MSVYRFFFGFLCLSEQSQISKIDGFKSYCAIMTHFVHLCTIPYFVEQNFVTVFSIWVMTLTLQQMGCIWCVLVHLKKSSLFSNISDFAKSFLVLHCQAEWRHHQPHQEPCHTVKLSPPQCLSQTAQTGSHHSHHSNIFSSERKTHVQQYFSITILGDLDF